MMKRDLVCLTALVLAAAGHQQAKAAQLLSGTAVASHLAGAFSQAGAGRAPVTWVLCGLVLAFVAGAMAHQRSKKQQPAH